MERINNGEHQTQNIKLSIAADASAAAHSALPIASQHELIAAHRQSAFKMAQSLLAGWGARLPHDEVESAADLALCEAARNYAPKPNATFATYLYYFIKGSVLQGLRFSEHAHSVREEDGRRRMVAEKYVPLSRAVQGADDKGDGERGEILCAEAEACAPDKEVYTRELRAVMLASLGRLSPIEREVVCLAVVLEDKVAVVARRLHYSRGHLFAVRHAALRKMRADLEDYQLAA